jgi:hypothetical protein
MAYDLQIYGLLFKDLTHASQAVLCECKAMEQEEWNGHVALWQQVRAATFLRFLLRLLLSQIFSRPYVIQPDPPLHSSPAPHACLLNLPQIVRGFWQVTCAAA